MNDEYFVKETIGSPFTLCGGVCLGGIERWAKRKGIDARKILTSIEDGDEDRGEFIAYAKRQGMRVRRLEKEDARAFQAGDLAGWKTRTALQNIEKINPSEDGEAILRSLDPIKGIIHKNRVHDVEAFQRLFEVSGIPRRGNGRMLA
jgi:hypothetical protein